MSSPEEWLVGELETVEQVDQRVYRAELPETASLPAYIYSRAGTANEYSHDGDSELPTIRYQVDCLADNPDVADELADELYALFSGRKDGAASAVFIDGDIDDHDAESATYRRIVDVMITWAGSYTGS